MNLISSMTILSLFYCTDIFSRITLADAFVSNKTSIIVNCLHNFMNYLLLFAFDSA